MKISVIIPIFNREDTIERAIKSVLNQKQADGTTFNIELIVVDDCSKDESVKKVQALNDERICLVQLEKNSGANVARNKGAELAKGAFLAFHDSDDEWLPGKLAKQLAFLAQTQADLVSCALSWRGPKGNFELHHKEGKINSSDLVSGNFLSTQTLLMKRACFEEVKFDEALPRLQDWDFVFRFSLNYQIAFLDEVLVCQYPAENSISKNSQAKQEAIVQIEKKFPLLYPMDKTEKAAFYYHLGSLLSSRKYFEKSFKIKPSFKTFKAVLLGK